MAEADTGGGGEESNDLVGQEVLALGAGEGLSLGNIAMWRDLADAKRAEPRMFVSGWEEDVDGVEETSDDEMETDDPEKAILKAAEHGDLDTVKKLLAHNPELVKTRDSDEYTPMHRASYNNHPEVIKVLLEAGGDPGARTESGWTPLHCAACWGCFDAASTLLTLAHADVNSLTHGRLTPLHLAAACTEDSQGGLKTSLMLMRTEGVDQNLKSAAGEVPGDIARRTSRALCRLFEMSEEERGQLDTPGLLALANPDTPAPRPP